MFKGKPWLAVFLVGLATAAPAALMADIDMFFRMAFSSDTDEVYFIF